MTEDEAKTKICCGPIWGGGDALNCAASKCMAWRWGSSASMDNPSRIPGEGKQTINPKAYGYCGLAGKP